MNYPALQAEILDVKYEALTDQELTDLLNTKDIPSKIAISSIDIEKYMMLSGIWIAFKRSQLDEAELARDAMERFRSFDLSIPSVDAALTGILSALVESMVEFTQVNVDEILAMGDVLISLAHSVSGSDEPLDIFNVQVTRGSIDMPAP